MSTQAIQQYYTRLDQYTRYGGTRNERSIRRAFANLLEEYCLPKHLMLVDELPLHGSQKRPDGTVKDASQLTWGHWESKDAHDVLTDEIREKLDIGYPTFNILFENSVDIVLIQEGQERLRGRMDDSDLLHRALTAFVEYERPEITAFRAAIERFKADIPDIVEKLRKTIAEQAASNPTFKQARAAFWTLCKDSINPEITAFDIREMLIQHILTAEIFNTVFAERAFHRENNIAKELEQVVNTFFTGKLRRDTLSKIESYYKAITAEAARISDHHEKQKFLKVVYENFYTAYNPKGADRLGIVYTPNEIVSFMIESTDSLLDKHFGRSLQDPQVEILDPATGTGTFITEIIERIPPQYLKHKYQHEIHANELAILPYYIANLNIEYSYQQKMEEYEPFEHIVFVDTLDNLGFDFQGKQGTFEGFGLSAENLKRIKTQNQRKISVIIGNPPYNANQMNENDNNKNRDYFENPTKRTGGVDGRIKATYVKQSRAQKTKVYDMYARFYRWASDRIAQDGIICFITNNSFVNARTFDGFRKCIQDEFDFAYIIDLGGNIRELSGKDGIYLNERHTIFGVSAAVGIAIMWLVKSSKRTYEECRINYIHPCDIRATRREKLEFLADHPFPDIPFEVITPDKDHNWINLTDNDFESLVPLYSKSNKNTIFSLVTNGINTARDEWVYDFNEKNLNNKIIYFIDSYNRSVKNTKRTDAKSLMLKIDYSIKWSDALLSSLKNLEILNIADGKFIKLSYRPFINKIYYSNVKTSDRLTRFHFELFGKDLNKENKIIARMGLNATKPFTTLSTNKIMDYSYLSPASNGCRIYSLYRYDSDGNRLDNITDWGLQQFTAHYQDDSISKDDIFHYVYAVLHHPAYRQTYEINLKREFPRIPFYADFRQWRDWGTALMDLHLNYERAEPYPLERQEELIPKDHPKAKLRAIPKNGTIILDENTTLLGVPEIAWAYTLGNRSALHWILDQYKEKKPRDKTIAEQFNTYRFAEYKEQVIDLLMRVCTVSVETMRLIRQMDTENTDGEDA